MENVSEIPLSAVLSEVSAPGAAFDLAYFKTDGSYGEKEGCRMAPSKNSLSDRRKFNRSGLLLLEHDGQPFNIYIDLLVKMNGQVIDHLS